MSNYIDRLIKQEEKRQEIDTELIASENFVSEHIKKVMGSCLTNKYAEGYPAERTEYCKNGKAGRYYGGCEIIDKVENYCCEIWQKAFRTTYHVNVQPHSGSQANAAAYLAVLKPGDTILSMSLNNGGHLSHGSKVNFSGKIYNIIHYGLDKNEYIDYNDFAIKVAQYRPNLILAGASAYSREIKFDEMYRIIENVKLNNPGYNPIFMADIAHIAGLVVAGLHQTPFGFCDIITTTTHKTLRGPRGALIFCKQELASKIDSAVFPGTQGGPLEHIIAAKAVAAEEACTDEYKEYINNVIINSRFMATYFREKGFDIVSDGTDNHLFILKLDKFGLTGAEVEKELYEHCITVNKNCIPNEKLSPTEASGIRIGTAAMTTKGWGINEFQVCADIIMSVIQRLVANKKIPAIITEENDCNDYLNERYYEEIKNGNNN